MTINNEALRQLHRLFIWRSVILTLAAVTLLLFYFNARDEESVFYIIAMFSLIYAVLSGFYYVRQIQLWKDTRRYRFMSWYYISFSVVRIVVLLVLSILVYETYRYSAFALLAFVMFLSEVVKLWLEYKYSLHFIAIFPEYVLIVNKKMQSIVPEDIQSVYYRNDILIFQLKNEITIFINFLEINNANTVRKLLAEWIEKNKIENCVEIIEEMRSKSAG
ncbi:MAG: hypothetical protein KatS3mg028_0589 [Bacteroidia bacterium]|nr:MAG: hypothetical protein KatS3mg028_0589 [Bacteroidia bacterium]